MEAVVLAAGLGSRLGNLTAKIPKTMLRIGDKRIIEVILEALDKKGVKKIIFVTGHEGRKLREFLTENFDLECLFVHNYRYKETNNIYSLFLALNHVSDDFYLINSDVLFHPKILEKIEGEEFLVVVDESKKLGKEEMKVIAESGRILKIGKYIDPEIATGEYIGVSKIPKKCLDKLLDCVKITIDRFGDNQFYEEAFQLYLYLAGDILYTSTNGLPWIEVDSYEDLAIARKIFKHVEW